MKNICLVIAALFINSVTVSAQPVVINNYGFNQAAVVFRTGTADVACAGGVCVTPSQNGYGAAVIPQSTAFFAFSNPNTIQFRVQQFVQVPHSEAIVTNDSFGNQVILNAGILSSPRIVQSRGQRLFTR